MSLLVRSSKPRIAIISNGQTPYRLHLHTRIARELSEIELWSLFTHEISNAPWHIKSPTEIRAVFFGQGEGSDGQDLWSSQWSEWRKGGAILRWIDQHDIRCAVLLGYNDVGRLRIIRGCKQRHVPCFLFGDSNILSERISGCKASVKKVIVGWAINTSTAILYCGRLGKAYFEKYGANPNNMFLFPYEPDYSLFESVTTSTLTAIRLQYHLHTDRRYLIYSGRLVHTKRVDLLLRAFATIVGERPGWDLIIAGDGPLRNCSLRDLSESISERVVWTGFVNDTNTLAALYRCADILVLPSDFEPWGVVVTEAATSLALICSSVVGSAAEVLCDGVNGRIFPSGDWRALADALMNVTDSNNVDRMKSASQRILKSWRSVSDPVVGLRSALQYAGVLSQRADA